VGIELPRLAKANTHGFALRTSEPKRDQSVMNSFNRLRQAIDRLFVLGPS